MKKNKKLMMAIASFATAGACLVGGTYAWFVMANTTSTRMDGTMVDVQDMEVGLRSAVDPTTVDSGNGTNYTLEGLGLSRDTTDGEIYWSTEASGFRAGTPDTPGTLDVIAHINGYANAFTPITTGAYATGEVINLQGGLSDLYPNTYTPAAPDTYYSYTLVFRTTADNEIYLNATTTAITDTSNNGSATRSLRLGFTSENSNALIDPTLTGTSTGTTDVGGRMDLDGDGVWDYYDNSDTTALYEIVYGEFAEYDASASDEHKGVTYLPVVSDSGVESVDGSNDNFLDAQSMNGVHVVDTAALTPATQTAQAIGSYLRGENNLATADDDGIAEVTITIWSEGWDADCINDIKLDEFSVRLGFVSTAGTTN